MLKYLKKYWIFCLLTPLCMMGEIYMDLMQPEMMKRIVDNGVLKSNMSLILQVGGRMMGLIAFGGCCGLLAAVFANIAAQSMGNDMRKDLFSKVMDLSFNQIDSLSTGSLVTRITNDVSQVEHMIRMTIRGLIRCILMFFGGIYMLFVQAPRFAVVAGFGLPFIVFFVVFFLKKVTPIYTVIQTKLDKINCIMEENIAGARVVKAYVKEEDELKNFSRANDELTGANLRAQTILAYMHPCVNIVMNLCVVAVIYVGGITVKNQGGITPGEIMASVTYLTMILMRVIFFANIFQTFTRASASWKRIKEILDLKPEQEDGNVYRTVRDVDKNDETGDAQTARGTGNEDRRGEIIFDHVSFAYPDAPESPVLKDISFSVGKGQTLAVIGATGSGKTTLAYLIARFYDVTEGKVLVDGVDVRDYVRKDLRDKVSVVLQKAELYSRSVKENVAWGKENATEDEIHQAAQIAQAEEFILKMSEQYDSNVTEKGHSLSGGQKQRVSVARGVIKKPEILVLDDSGSALDLKTEGKLHSALESHLQGTTVILIAQRIASVKNADSILVLDNGRIAAMGTHSQLLEESEIYREIYDSQLKREGAV